MKTKTSTFVLLVTVWSGMLLAEPLKITLSDALQQNYESGRISRAEYVAYELMGITNKTNLPEEYKSYPHAQTRMGTALMMEARALLDQSTGKDKLLLQSVLMRPGDLPLEKISPAGRFKLHYTDIGMNAAADTFITRSAAAFDEVYELIIDELGYDKPPVDDLLDPEIDVYVYAVGGYGLSTPESPAPTATYPNGYTSYISMDNTFTSTYKRGIDGMLVTAAHEFFHTVQLGMRSFTTTEFDSRWLFEGTAVWMEDYAYSEVDDYIQYLPSYMHNLDMPFYTFNGLHEYGSCIFYHMLVRKYGADILRTIWNEFATHDLWETLDNALQTVGSSFAGELVDHMIWNYFTGDRAQPDVYYPEGELYPEVEPNQAFEIETTTGFSGEAGYLGGHYVKLAPTTFGELFIQPEMTTPAFWMYAVINNPLGLEANAVTASGANNVLLSEISASNEIIVIPVNVHIPASSSSKTEPYEFRASLGETGDFTAGIQNIFPNPFQPNVHSNGIRINVRLTEKTSEINYFILDENGGQVFSDLIKLDSPKSGDFPLFWNGLNKRGEAVAAGIYLVYVDGGQAIEPGKIAVIR